LLNIQRLFCLACFMNKTNRTNETEASRVARVRLRLIEGDELAAWNALVDEKHYLSTGEVFAV